MADPVHLEGFRDYTRIGSGGFSTVYRAYQERFQRHVAVKVLATTITDEQGQKRFLRECGIAGRLSNHPNIVSLYEAGFTADDQPYIVFEYMSGGSFADQLARRGPLPLSEALNAGVKLCGALTTVHAEGVTHRDIKPLNVLLSSFGEP